MDQCPSCKVSWIGEEIPKKQQRFYGATHYKREIGIEIPTLYDGVAAYQCPDCKEEFARCDAPWAQDLFASFKKMRNKNKT